MFLYTYTTLQEVADKAGRTNKEQRHLFAFPHHPRLPQASDDVYSRRSSRAFGRAGLHCEWDMIRYESKRAEWRVEPMTIRIGFL